MSNTKILNALVKKLKDGDVSAILKDTAYLPKYVADTIESAFYVRLRMCGNTDLACNTALCVVKGWIGQI